VAEDAFVEVTGHGSATTTPDIVRLHVTAVAKAPAVGEAFEAADSALKAMLAAARDHDVANTDIRSTHVDVRAGRRGRGSGPGFRAAMGIRVTVHDVAVAGRVLASMVDAGGAASRVQGISLAVTAPEEALEEARAKAWANALEKAEQYARLSGRDLGAVLRVSEGPQAQRFGHVMEAQAFAADSAVSVEPGSQTVAAVITVRWALR
jgi:uncharacterized protein